MKAIDYYEKYHEGLVSEDKDIYVKAMNDLFFEAINEVQSISKQRNVKNDSGFISIVKEVNQKLNSMKKIFRKNGNEFSLKKNFFITLVVNHMLSDTIGGMLLLQEYPLMEW